MAKAKALFFFFIFFTSIARSQQPTWKINGTLAALRSSVKKSMPIAIRDLFHLNVLDSLVHSRAIPTRVIEELKNETDINNIDNYLFYILESQPAINQQDYEFMGKLISAQAKKDGSTPICVLYMLLLKGSIPSEFIDLFRRPWDSISIYAKTAVMELMLRQKDIPDKDFNLIHGFLTSNLSNYIKTNSSASQKWLTDRENPEKDFSKEQKGVLRGLCTAYPHSKQVRSFFENLVRTNTFENNKRIYTLLVDDDVESPNIYPVEMFAIFKQLAEMQGEKNADRYLQTVADFEDIPELDLKELVNHLATFDCLKRENILEKLVFKRALQPEILNVIPTEQTRTNCSGWLHFVNFLNDSIRYSPGVIQRIGIPVFDSTTQFNLFHYFAQKPVLSTVEMNFIKRTMAADYENYRDDLFRGLYFSQLNPDVITILRPYLRNDHNKTDQLITKFLLTQKVYTSADLAYFNRLLTDPLTTNQSEIIEDLANQKILQTETLDILKKILDTSENFYGLTAYTLAKRAAIPDMYWPYIVTDMLQGKTPELSPSDLGSQMPEKYCLSMADSFSHAFFDNSSEIKRYNLYVLGGGSATINNLMEWIYPSGIDLPAVEGLTDSAKEKSLIYFDTVWDRLHDYSDLKECLARQVIRVTQHMTPLQIKNDGRLLKRMLNRFEEDNKLENQFAELKLELEKVNGVEKRFVDFISRWGYLLLLHPFFWALIIFLYPTDKKVQSFFFWNSSVRKWLGLGYVNLLLIHAPFLRNRILSPFRNKMLGDGRLEEFTSETYFTDFPLITAGTKQRVTIDDVGALRGHVIIRGDSGLGKTMILRRLLSQSKMLSVFILAEKCQTGVEAAIASKIFGITKVAGFEGFIKSIIYNGYLDVYLDGINEVGQSTLGKIEEFMVEYDNCQGYFTTQPTAWKIPGHAIVIDILPLEDEFLSSFLHKRYPIGVTKKIMPYDDFKEKCDIFLFDHVGGKVAAEQRLLNQKILSNPYDLTIVAQLIIDWPEEKLNLLSLQKVYFELMAKKYSNDYNLKEKFPLEKFSEAIFQLRYVNEISELPYDEFHDEIDCMHAFKMAISRISEQGVEEWYFRHDKLRDFFILQTFVAKKERQKMLIADPRFRGVYFLMATLLSLDDAKTLERILIDFAADNNDHSISDDFIKLLRTRQQADPDQKKQNPDRQDSDDPSTPVQS